MKRSFFGALQGFIKDGFGLDYGGRYMALLLEHVCAADPRPFRRFLSRTLKIPGLDHGSLVISREYPFDGRHGRCRADLAVMVQGRLACLVELKYRDVLREKKGLKPAQLDDYLDYCRRKGCGFILLYRRPQSAADIGSIRNAGHACLHYSALVGPLQRSSHPASRLFIQYMQEEGLVVETIDVDHLCRFLHRLLLPWGGGGRVNKTSEIGEGPQQFQAVLENLRLISGDITPRLREATGNAQLRNATVDFVLYNDYSVPRLSRQLRKIPARQTDVYLELKARQGGTIEVFAQNALVRGTSLYVEYGFELDVTKGRTVRDKLAIQQYARLHSSEIYTAKASDDDWDGRFSDWGKLALKDFALADKASIEADFISLLRRAARTTVRSGVIRDAKKLRALRGLAAL